MIISAPKFDKAYRITLPVIGIILKLNPAARTSEDYHAVVDVITLWCDKNMTYGWDYLNTNSWLDDRIYLYNDEDHLMFKLRFAS